MDVNKEWKFGKIHKIKWGGGGQVGGGVGLVGGQGGCERYIGGRGGCGVWGM